MDSCEAIRRLAARGVKFPAPESVFIGPEVEHERIERGTIIHPGCRIVGRDTFIGPGCELGAEGPATVQDCQLGEDVKLAGGFFSRATFLDGASFGSCAHVRPGCLLEECANAAHAVGIKQTILFPYVTLGSLINFCDCLMAGGFGARNHGEVGSSYVHFNFTPRGDKATPSIFGDVPRGVMLDQPPVFLGGQGGAVGPRRVEFGVVVPAGIILRDDITTAGTAQRGSAAPAPGTEYSRRPARRLPQIIKNNLFFFGNLRALQAWYRHVRSGFMQGRPHAQACHAGALRRLDEAVEERLLRLDELAQKMVDQAPAPDESEAASAARRFVREWPEMRIKLADEKFFGGDTRLRDLFLAALPASAPYLQTVRTLPAESKKNGAAWLQSIVDAASALWRD